MDNSELGTYVPGYKWAKEVKRLYGYTCVGCGVTLENDCMQAHHVVPRSKDRNLENILENGVSLCRWCHWKMHSFVGREISDSPYAKEITRKIQEIKECEIILTIDKGMLDRLAEKHGEKINGYINRLIAEDMAKNKGTED